MTDTDLITAPAEQESAGSAGPDSGGQPAKTRARAARTGLSGMVLSELRTVAGELGIKGTSGMRKGDLIAAIKERQSGAAGKSADAKAEAKSPPEVKNVDAKAADVKAADAKAETKATETRRRSAKASSEDGQLSIVESAGDGDSGRAPPAPRARRPRLRRRVSRTPTSQGRRAEGRRHG